MTATSATSAQTGRITDHTRARRRCGVGTAAGSLRRTVLSGIAAGRAGGAVMRSPAIGRLCPGCSPARPDLAQDPQRLDTVLPGDLLALLPAPGAVADRHLVRADAPLEQFAGHPGLHAEPRLANVQVAVERQRHQL